MAAKPRPNSATSPLRPGLLAFPAGYTGKKRLRIGLLGGTFNPPHEGHIHLSRTAARLLKLDAVWWLVSPGNPLKANPPPPLKTRIEWCQEKTKGLPRVAICDLESRLGTRYTIDTVRALQTLYPQIDFVWICGSDIALEFHRWRSASALLDRVSFACIARPPTGSHLSGNKVRMGPRRKQVVLDRPARAPLTPSRWYWIMQGPRVTQSSTALRAAAGTRQPLPQT